MFSQYKIVRLTAPIFYPSAEELAAYAARGLQVTVVEAEAPNEMIPLVHDADIVVVIGTKVPTPVVEAMTQCRLIARQGTGTDKIDVARATELGIVVANTPYFCIEEQADHGPREFSRARRGHPRGRPLDSTESPRAARV